MKKKQSKEVKEDQSTSLISLQNVTKQFGKTVVLDNLSIDIIEGEIIGLIGRSGCGKSTLLKILIGFYAANSGNILYRGEDITKKLDKLKHIVGYTTQENSFYDKLTIYENMKYYSKLYGYKPEDRKLKHHIHDVLESVGLLSHKNKLAEKISGGMKRRLDFAISLIHDPEILIMDEPTTGLDPLLVKVFWHIVKQFNKKGKTVIVITHLFNEIEENCDRFAIMNKGRFEFAVRVKDFKKKFHNNSFDEVFQHYTK
ncbi:ABC transporter ATP-binding protein [Candidatus Woesearchaeota archaeon]|jgi:ABC-2 type transport system ATP-binding protein|nr:ABC transporter ATP-binding protein [Candidatus Woesearchaeota archaeon]MBT6518904.1 ABC transporter ATP-binding protein [Candidatus Woesearchaeota archaeon]MBT7367572.1 ABC transporter ATP-binding protein [Candidatus Woesearchaeota archaeon]